MGGATATAARGHLRRRGLATVTLDHMELSTAGVETELEAHRTRLTGYCYRMLGSPFDAEDAVQETMIRAWRNIERFEGRSALSSWLYRIATNVCMDMLNGRKRRERPMDMGPAGTVESAINFQPEESWIEPAPDVQVLASDGSEGGDPAELVEASETVKLAFVAILQDLPPRQRAVLILRDVLRWQATEVAELLDTTVASVNSALQRARATLAAKRPAAEDGSPDIEEVQRRLLERYVDAFESYDVDSLVALLHEDATFSMPPIDLWLRGREAVAGWLRGPGAECEGSRLLPTRANGSPAFGQYRRHADGSGHYPWGLVVLEMDGDGISGLNTFLSVDRLFPLFGLPVKL